MSVYVPAGVTAGFGEVGAALPLPFPTQPVTAKRTQTAVKQRATRRARRLSRKRGTRKSEHNPNPAKWNLEFWKSKAVCDAVVVTVTVKFAAFPVVRVKVAGLTVQEASSGAPLQVSARVPLNPVEPVRDRL